jgi:hypothetical protein
MQDKFFYQYGVKYCRVSYKKLYRDHTTVPRENGFIYSHPPAEINSEESEHGGWMQVK